jgi:glycosyltransferase involved in cell wall biosynthesis
VKRENVKRFPSSIPNSRRFAARRGTKSRHKIITGRPVDFEGLAGIEVVEIAFRGGIDRLRWQHVALPRVLARLRPDVYHDTKNALPLRCPWPLVVTVHDLAYYRCPATFSFPARVFLRAHTRWAVARADRIIAVSENTRRDIIEIFSCDARRVVAIPNGISERYFEHVPHEDIASVRRRYQLPPRFVLFAGTLQPRKNVLALVRAFRTLVSRESVPHELVLVGRFGWKVGNLRRELAQGHRVRCLGVVTDDELLALYHAAEVFVSPSSYEGFGLTFGEAMACGTPVVTTRVSSLPEVCGSSAAYLETPSEIEIERVLCALLKNDAERIRLAVSGRRQVERFRWDACALRTLDVYEEVLSQASYSGVPDDSEYVTDDRALTNRPAAPSGTAP